MPFESAGRFLQLNRQGGASEKPSTSWAHLPTPERKMAKNDEFKIEKGIPMPLRSARSGSKYPFLEMAVGDSFFATVPEGKELGTHRNTLMANARYVTVKNGAVFCSRTVDNGVRIWRIS